MVECGIRGELKVTGTNMMGNGGASSWVSLKITSSKRFLATTLRIILATGDVSIHALVVSQKKQDV